MAKKQRRPREPFKLPARMMPDYDHWGTPAEEAKRAKREEWLRETDNADRFYFEWLPGYLAERRRLFGMGPRRAPRRRGPLPARVRDLLATLERDPAEGDAP